MKKIQSIFIYLFFLLTLSGSRDYIEFIYSGTYTFTGSKKIDIDSQVQLALFSLNRENNSESATKTVINNHCNHFTKIFDDLLPLCIDLAYILDYAELSCHSPIQNLFRRTIIYPYHFFG